MIQDETKIKDRSIQCWCPVRARNVKLEN